MTLCQKLLKQEGTARSMHATIFRNLSKVHVNGGANKRLMIVMSWPCRMIYIQNISKCSEGEVLTSTLNVKRSTCLITT